MSIFRREPVGSDPAAPASPAGPPQGRMPTRIAPGTRVLGEITGATELVVDGEVEGSIRVETTVTVGPEGRVQGPIAARVVRVGGRVAGDVRGGERVELLPTGSLEGNITAPRMAIGEGAFFKGRVEMQSPGDTSQADQVRETRPQQASVGPVGD
jgi:cytoskeletal protein CcmA (bactofilin family)